MPRISRDDQLERDLTSRLQAMIDDPLTPQYVVAKCIGTLATMLRRRAKRISEKQAAARARKAERDQANFVYPNVLPDNGRMGPKPTGPVQPFVIPPGVNRP
jgi:hypothetical protein